MSTAVSSSPTNSADTTLNPQILRIAVVVILGSLMSTLDTAIVNIAIGDLSKSFRTAIVF